MKPDTRRAFRTVVNAISALLILALIAVFADKLDQEWLGWIVLGLVIITGIREIFHGAENVTARIKIAANKDGLNTELDTTENGNDK